VIPVNSIFDGISRISVISGQDSRGNVDFRGRVSISEGIFEEDEGIGVCMEVLF
jgi:hypothetical protein